MLETIPWPVIHSFGDPLCRSRKDHTYPVAPVTDDCSLLIRVEEVDMRYSQYLLPTMKEIPSEAEVPSHQLMLRAGMIRKLAAGIYSYLPFGLRAIRKVEGSFAKR